MEGNESAINRVGRAVWTVWGYLSGAVGRYLRPEVRNEEAQQQEDTVSISKSYKELKVKEQEKERDETKMREDLQYPMVAVRAAAVQWEKRNVAHHSHEEKVKSKHTFADPDAGDRKLQMKDKEKTLDDKSGSRKTHDGQITEPDDSPANIDADVKNQDRTFSGSMEDALNVERNETNQEQTKKSEEEEKMVQGEFDESEEEPIKSVCIAKGLLAEEADLNERRKHDQEQGSEEEEERVDEMIERDNNETEEKTVEGEFIVQAKEAELNVERSESNQELEEEGIEIMRRENDDTEEELIRCEFIEQGLLAKEADLKVKRSESNQEQRKKQEEEAETTEELIKSEFINKGLLAKETDLNVGRSKNYKELGREEEGLLSKEADLDVERDENYQEQGRKQEEEEDDVGEMKSENDETEEEPIKDKLIDQFLLSKEADLNMERHVIEVCSEETRQEAEGNEKDGHHEGFSTCEKFTNTGTVEEQKVFDTEMKKTSKQPEDIDIDVEMTQIENAETFQKVFEPINKFDDEDNTLAVTIKKQQLEKSKEQKATSEEELNVSDTIHDHDGSQRPVTMTKQDFEAVITQPETGTGNQTETAETTSKVRAEVAAVDVKKSAERETVSHEQPVDKEEVAVQEITGQCFFEQGSLLDLVSADTRINEAPFSGIIKSIPLGQVEETVIESLDEMKGSSLQELDECSSEDGLKPKAKSSFPDRTAEMFETRMSKQAQPDHEISLVENICDNSIANETPVEDQINQDKFTEQGLAAEASSHGLSKALYLPEIESEQETLEMQTDSQKDKEEQKRTDKTETGILDEIKGVTTCLGVEEMEAHERKEHTSDLEGCEETSESNIVLNDAREWEKELAEEMTGVQTGGEINRPETEEPIDQDEGMDKRHLDISKSEASKEISQEQDEQVRHGESVVDGKEDVERRGKSGLKRGFEKIAGVNDKDKPSVLTDLLPPSQASSLDFTIQKSKIAVKNPLVRPPKDPRTLINMASVEPLTRPPHPLQTGFVKKSHLECASLPSKGVIGFKLPGLGSGFPALRKTEIGGEIRDGEDSASATSQKSDSGSQSAEDNLKQETSPHKPKWTPPRQPGMGNPMMMAELKSKLKKPSKE
ncbi:trichohyalin isoform X4 [Tachysurus ichikawai]